MHARGRRNIALISALFDLHAYVQGAIAQWHREEDDEYDYHDFCDCEACTGIMGSCFPCVGAFGLGPEVRFERIYDL